MASPTTTSRSTARRYRCGAAAPTAVRSGAMATTGSGRGRSVSAVLRDGDQVTPLELFFDLVFVLAITQCTALMAARPDVGGPAPGPGRARGAVVGVGRVRLAHQRGRPRGGRRAPGHLRRDGGAAGRVAVRARGVRRARPHVRDRLRARAGRPARAVPRGQPGRRPRSAARCGSAWSRAPRSAWACWSPRRRSTATPSSRCGWRRSPSTCSGPYLFGSEGWKLVPAPLRRAPRPDPDHRPRRVDRGHRRRRRGGRRRRRHHGGRARHRPGGRDVVGLLRRGRPRRRAPPQRRRGRARSRTRWRATRTRSCTSRWSPASC